MTPQIVSRRLAVLNLIELAGCLQVRGGSEAQQWCRKCWCTIARLEDGCDCVKDASELVTSARQWLEAA